jgi:hypothetical protein
MWAVKPQLAQVMQSFFLFSLQGILPVFSLTALQTGPLQGQTCV